MKLESLLQDTPWLFGQHRPTALDAHAVLLFARMKDTERENLLSARLIKYSDAAFETQELQSDMEGRRTMPQKF
jgi:hypothetical protein